MLDLNKLTYEQLLNINFLYNELENAEDKLNDLRMLKSTEKEKRVSALEAFIDELNKTINNMVNICNIFDNYDVPNKDALKMIDDFEYDDLESIANDLKNGSLINYGNQSLKDLAQEEIDEYLYTHELPYLIKSAINVEDYTRELEANGTYLTIEDGYECLYEKLC